MHRQQRRPGWAHFCNIGRLPELVSDRRDGHLDADKVSLEVREAIRNPTERMRKSFMALPMPHKWVLISMLELGYYPKPKKVRRLYEAQCPVEARRPFEEVFEELTESFVKIGQWTPGGGKVDRLDPSEL